MIFLDFDQEMPMCIFITKGLVYFRVLSFKSGLISSCFPTIFLCIFSLHKGVSVCQLDDPRMYGDLSLQGQLYHLWRREMSPAVFHDYSH